MSGPFPIEVTGNDGITILTGVAEFPGPATPGPTQTGAAPPGGVVVPTHIGSLYVDTANGGAYIAIGATSADWVLLGGQGVGGGVSSSPTAVFVQTPTAVLGTGVGEGQIHALATGVEAKLKSFAGDAVVANDDGAGATVLGFYGATPVLQPAISGALSTVADAPAKAVLTSIIAALSTVAGLGLATDGTT